MLDRRQGSHRIFWPLLIAGTVLLAGVASAADRVPVWVPTSVAVEGLERTADLYYGGSAGSLVGVEPQDAFSLEVLGARRILLDEGEVLYMFLLEDAARATFEPPSRVILGTGHEVLVATGGEVPRLTAEAVAILQGLEQPVRISMRPIAWQGVPVEPPMEPLRDVDPLIQSMLNDLTQANFFNTLDQLFGSKSPLACGAPNVYAFGIEHKYPSVPSGQLTPQAVEAHLVVGRDKNGRIGVGIPDGVNPGLH